MQFKGSFLFLLTVLALLRRSILGESMAEEAIVVCGVAWRGVEFDEETGRVVGLDLSSNCLYGSIDSDSSLFKLVHLQRVDLALNNFNFSEVPESIQLLSKFDASQPLWFYIFRPNSSCNF